MDAKEYLKKARLAEQKVEQMKEMKDELAAEIDEMPEVVRRYVMLETELLKEIAETQETKKEVIDTIQSLDDELQIKVLYEKWIHGKRLERIAEELDYSFSHIKNTYTKGMKEIEKNIKNA